MEWKYLFSEVFYTRQMIASCLVRECKNIIEVGGYRTGTYEFLRSRHDKIVCIDPVFEKRECRKLSAGRYKITDLLTFIPGEFHEAFDELEALSNFGLIALGFEIKKAHYGPFCDLVSRSKVAIIEGWEDYSKYRGVLSYIAMHSDKEIAFRLRMDMSGNEFADSENSWPVRTSREMVVFR